ncbi:hypothetical protein [Blastopirellula marina]|uniref:Uncharacterized protein n=1 Tax=Blastopirellula marina DSM 3645 TaxID=314230 RepID=A3ZRC1_9BACT|nr:hypothetical protein [Blastopirellula marina]EAQ80690.1 hypothetical protein DSM3645_11756 [Blastopirellula marina DSM 3645]
MTQRSIILTTIVAVLVLIATVDHYQYEAHGKRRSAIVSEFGGRTGSLMGWPWGKEVMISLPRPLSNEELRRLAILNAAGRDYVSVWFQCELNDEQLKAVKQVLSRCGVHASPQEVDR